MAPPDSSMVGRASRQHGHVNSPEEERDARQYDLMARRLHEFRSGEIPIGRVIADLEGLLNALAMASEDWEEAFREEWATLEIDYAVALDRQSPLPTASDPGIAGAITELDRLVRLRREPEPE